MLRGSPAPQVVRRGLLLCCRLVSLRLPPPGLSVRHICVNDLLTNYAASRGLYPAGVRLEIIRRQFPPLAGFQDQSKFKYGPLT